MVRLHGVREERQANWWDSFGLDDRDVDLGWGTRRSRRLFGNDRIGETNLCNLQVAGMLVMDQTSLIRHAYARTTITSLHGAMKDAFNTWAHTTVVTLIVGDRPMRQWPLYDLLQDGPWVPPSRRGERMTEEEAAQMVIDRKEGLRLVIVPVRQNISVNVESDPGALEALQTFFPLATKRSSLAARIWIHLEGLTVRDVP